jgi:hypothetical protein
MNVHEYQNSIGWSQIRRNDDWHHMCLVIAADTQIEEARISARMAMMPLCPGLHGKRHFLLDYEPWEWKLAWSSTGLIGDKHAGEHLSDHMTYRKREQSDGNSKNEWM